MENKVMYLKDFAESRGVPYKTVYSYINRNKSLIEKYKKVKNGKVWIDKKGVEILSEKYPLAVEKENNLMKELVEAQAKIISLQEILVNLQPKLMLADEQAEALAKTEENYKEAISKLSHERAKNEGLEYDLKSSRSIANSLREELKELEKSLEKERSKSWWDKLRGK